MKTEINRKMFLFMCMLLLFFLLGCWFSLLSFAGDPCAVRPKFKSALRPFTVRLAYSPVKESL